MPNMIRSGVIRKPPPTPKRPESKPTANPNPTGMRILMLVSATGKYRYIQFLLVWGYAVCGCFAMVTIGRDAVFTSLLNSREEIFPFSVMVGLSRTMSMLLFCLRKSFRDVAAS
jgi:hypothetical protein